MNANEMLSAALLALAAAVMGGCHTAPVENTGQSAGAPALASEESELGLRPVVDSVKIERTVILPAGLATSHVAIRGRVDASAGVEAASVLKTEILSVQDDEGREIGRVRDPSSMMWDPPLVLVHADRDHAGYHLNLAASCQLTHTPARLGQISVRTAVAVATAIAEYELEPTPKEAWSEATSELRVRVVSDKVQRETRVIKLEYVIQNESGLRWNRRATPTPIELVAVGREGIALARAKPDQLEGSAPVMGTVTLRMAVPTQPVDGLILKFRYATAAKVEILNFTISNVPMLD